MAQRRALRIADAILTRLENRKRNPWRLVAILLAAYVVWAWFQAHDACELAGLCY